MFRSISGRSRAALQVLLLALLVTCCTPAQAQSPDTSTPGRLILVLPFENKSGQSALAWIGDSFPDTLNQRLNSAGFLTITRDDRQFALDHLGLPVDFKPSRATTIRIAQTLDADYVIVGSYTVTNLPTQRIAVQAQILEVNRLRMSPPIPDSAELPRLLDVENAIAWKIARQIDPHFSVALQTFLSASAGVKLSAFENYIRGIGATTPQERTRRLQQAVVDTPNYAAALLALGKTQYIARDYEHAAITLAKVPPTDRLALEASFYLGLARFNSAKYAEAEQAFTFVASRLPLPEVLNNQAVAITRQNRDAIAVFQRASAADPNDADYHYNLAVSLYRRGDFANAQREIELALKLRPASTGPDTEAKQLSTRIAAGRTPTQTKDTFEPQERIRRAYSEAPFRQAAFQLDQLNAARLATLPPAQQATQYIQTGNDYLAQGLLPEAEQQFQSAIVADRQNPAAHTGLAQVREQSASADEARIEAQLAIKLKPNAPAYLVLARLDLKEDKLPAAASDVSNALRIEPKNAAAQALKQTLQSRNQPLP
jgi:tetratricopeptide (TPR) repeat protein